LDVPTDCSSVWLLSISHNSAHAHAAGPKAGGERACLVGEKHARTRIGRAALDRPQGGRTIKPSVDFHACVAAEQSLGRALVRAAVGAQQSVFSCRQVRLLLAFIQKLLHGVEQICRVD